MEILDIVDEEGRPTGETVERERAHREGILHRTAHVWVLRERDGKTEILLQKRSRNKDSFPGLYDTSSAGHIPAGVDFVPSALRELEEELGLRAEASQLSCAGSFRIRYEKEFHGRLFRDNEFARVYVYREPLDESALRPQESEIEELRWFDLREVRAALPARRDKFCVPSEALEILVRFLKKEGKLL